jgi:hypothetical protein
MIYIPFLETNGRLESDIRCLSSSANTQVYLQELENALLRDRHSLVQFYDTGLNYTDICMPFFHRATLNMASLPPLLTLAICSIGAYLSDESGAREIGQLIHSHAWHQTFIVSCCSTGILFVVIIGGVILILASVFQTRPR